MKFRRRFAGRDKFPVIKKAEEETPEPDQNQEAKSESDAPPIMSEQDRKKGPPADEKRRPDEVSGTDTAAQPRQEGKRHKNRRSDKRSAQNDLGGKVAPDKVRSAPAPAPAPAAGAPTRATGTGPEPPSKEPKAPVSTSAKGRFPATPPPPPPAPAGKAPKVGGRDERPSAKGADAPKTPEAESSEIAAREATDRFEDFLPEGLHPVQVKWFELLAWLKRSPELTWLGGTFVTTLLAGYLIAAFVFFPGPWRAERMTVPELIGLSQSEAAGALQNLNLVVGDVESVSHPEAPSGQVVWQDPPEGVVVEEGMQVQLSVSHGPQQVPIPDVANYDEAIARTLLEAAGLNVDITRIPTAAPRGVAVNTRPAIGTTRRPGDRVELLVSEGAPTIRVPDLKGMTVEEAGEILRTLGLSVGSFEVRGSRAQPPGTIFEQSPPAGTLAAPGTRVGGFTVRRP